MRGCEIDFCHRVCVIFPITQFSPKLIASARMSVGFSSAYSNDMNSKASLDPAVGSPCWLRVVRLLTSGLSQLMRRSLHGQASYNS
jgi:hypothetical protein